MSETKKTRRNLSFAKETVRKLSDDELGKAPGAAGMTVASVCSTPDSGCCLTHYTMCHCTLGCI